MSIADEDPSLRRSLLREPRAAAPMLRTAHRTLTALYVAVGIGIVSFIAASFIDATSDSISGSPDAAGEHRFARFLSGIAPPLLLAGAVLAFAAYVAAYLARLESDLSKDDERLAEPGGGSGSRSGREGDDGRLEIQTCRPARADEVDDSFWRPTSQQ